MVGAPFAPVAWQVPQVEEISGYTVALKNRCACDVTLPGPASGGGGVATAPELDVVVVPLEPPVPEEDDAPEPPPELVVPPPEEEVSPDPEEPAPCCVPTPSSVVSVPAEHAPRSAPATVEARSRPRDRFMSGLLGVAVAAESEEREAQS
jgi:outer membrane biosynthesis protein TonB